MTDTIRFSHLGPDGQPVSVELRVRMSTPYCILTYHASCGCLARVWDNRLFPTFCQTHRPNFTAASGSITFDEIRDRG